MEKLIFFAFWISLTWGSLIFKNGVFNFIFYAKLIFLREHGVSKITPLKPQLNPPKTQCRFSQCGKDYQSLWVCSTLLPL
ncbi:hypothetical protein C2R90_04935 [Helicobacter pylori]|nr:hypothetical protein C2R90_04935 [Helicobacter pylori]